MKAKLTKYGFGADYRGAHCRLTLGGRLYLGEIVGMGRDETTGYRTFTVRFFNGKPWPFEPNAVAVDILEREYEPLDDGPADKPCRCPRCIAPEDCPSCQAVNGLCKACEDHYAALADAAEGESRAS